MVLVTPPADLRGDHDELVTAFRDVIDVLDDLPGFQSLDRQPPDPRLVQASTRLTRAYNRWNASLRARYGKRILAVQGVGMAPALCEGDAFVVDRRTTEAAPHRWDIVVFELPFDSERTFLKRVVGLPGETISVRDGVIYINGVQIEGDTYALMPPNYTVEPMTIPPGRYYVLGDNRRNSFDSHAWAANDPSDDAANNATVPQDLIEGVLPADTTGCLD